jgi:hypothetical protein
MNKVTKNLQSQDHFLDTVSKDAVLLKLLQGYK